MLASLLALVDKRFMRRSAAMLAQRKSETAQQCDKLCEAEVMRRWDRTEPIHQFLMPGHDDASKFPQQQLFISCCCINDPSSTLSGFLADSQSVKSSRLISS
ncbi:hypothetical protein ACFO0J_01720 [Castellaniella hirudinis]|uniref:Uncharacterized protein n=1 Tax=Castellaniella hirudinis TaxID=1144617 RepID=A0ABV8RWK5_9BURK